MNHIRIATQALRYRLATISDSYSRSRFDPEAIATVAVECGDPVIDAAIRRLGTAWTRAGIDPDLITEPWSGPRVDALFAEDPTLLDALDDVIKTVHRVQFSRPRRGTRPSRPRHRPGVGYTR